MFKHKYDYDQCTKIYFELAIKLNIHIDNTHTRNLYSVLNSSIIDRQMVE